MPGKTEGIGNQTGALDVGKQKGQAVLFLQSGWVGILFWVEVSCPRAEPLGTDLLLILYYLLTLYCFP